MTMHHNSMHETCNMQEFGTHWKTRASGRNVGKVFNPVVKLVLENQPFLMPEPAEKPSLQYMHSMWLHGYVTITRNIV